MHIYDETTSINRANADYTGYVYDTFIGEKVLDFAVFGDTVAIIDEDGPVDMFPIVAPLKSRVMREVFAQYAYKTDVDFMRICY